MTHAESPNGDTHLQQLHTTLEPSLAHSVLELEAAPRTTPEAPPAQPESFLQRACFRLLAFGRKAYGVTTALKPSRRKLTEALFDGLFAGVGIASLAALNIAAQRIDLLQLIASFGASAVLVYAAPASPLAQPRNLVGGNVVSSICGVAMSKAFDTKPNLQWLASGLAVMLAVFFMGILGVTHPPAGATALIAVVGGPSIQHQGWLYIVQPVLTGSLFMLVTAILFNNAHHMRTYPQYW